MPFSRFCSSLVFVQKCLRLLFGKAGSAQFSEVGDFLREFGKFFLFDEQQNVSGQFIVRLTAEHMPDGRKFLEGFSVFDLFQQNAGRSVHDPPEGSLVLVGAPDVIKVVALSVDERADAVDVFKEPLTLFAGKGFDLPGVGRVDVRSDLDLGNA